jgi:hypothetical protein
MAILPTAIKFVEVDLLHASWYRRIQMKRLFSVLLMLVVASPVFADYVPTYIKWNGWVIKSSEDGNIHEGQNRYPLTYLFDGDPTTAWVFRGPRESETRHFEWKSRYGIALNPSKPVQIDGIRIMNGYNKSQELFLKNNRFLRMSIRLDGKLVKTVSLSDKMGWHTVSLPKQKVSEIELYFTQIRRGKIDDVCVSGLELLGRGKPLPMNMPNAVLYSLGSSCGCGSNPSFITLRGKRLAEDFMTEGEGVEWSPNKRYVASIDRYKGKDSVWIGDFERAKVKRYAGFRKVSSLSWEGNRRLVVYCNDGKTHKISR